MSDTEWRTQEDIRLRALVICRDRDPGTPVCTDGPCAQCLEEARRERLAATLEVIENRVRLLSAETAAIEMIVQGKHDGS